MKLFTCLLVCGASAAFAQTNLILTLDGRAYSNAVIQRAEPDGLVVEYGLPRRYGMAKLKFTNLTESLRRQFDYDPARAAKFESNRAVAVQQELQHQLEVEREAKAFRDEQRKQRDQIAADEAIVKAQAEEQERQRLEEERLYNEELAGQQNVTDDVYLQRRRIRDRQPDLRNRNPREVPNLAPDVRKRP